VYGSRTMDCSLGGFGDETGTLDCGESPWRITALSATAA
jgi:hypothetical protein